MDNFTFMVVIDLPDRTLQKNGVNKNNIQGMLNIFCQWEGGRPPPLIGDLSPKKFFFTPSLYQRTIK